LLHRTPDRTYNQGYTDSDERLPVWTDSDSKVENPRRDSKRKCEME